jgi:hypothetical protein
MTIVTLRPGDEYTKDPADAKVYQFNWSTKNLAALVTILSSVWTISAIKPSRTDTALLQDVPSILVGDRKTQVRLTGGTLGQTYEIANLITTSEAPQQTKERSFRIKIENQ